MYELKVFLSQSWPWYISGPLISLIMFLMIYYGKTFGISSTFKTACTIAGAGRFIPFFKMDWRNHAWNLVFVAGAIFGGFIASEYLTDPDPIDLSERTIERLIAYNIDVPAEDYLPTSLFSWESLLSTKGLVFMVLGGFLVGFGTRYGGGCTSGHGITGVSKLDTGSFIAIIGFFIGGLIMTHLLLPFLFQLK